MVFEGKKYGEITGPINKLHVQTTQDIRIVSSFLKSFNRLNILGKNVNSRVSYLFDSYHHVDYNSKGGPIHRSYI